MLGQLSYRQISEIGVKEKYLRLDHYNTLKTWWARRPTTTVRSLLIKEILKRTDKENELLDIELFSEINPPKNIFNSFKEKFKTNELTVLDVFSGGGSIPFESARLGFQTCSAELNPVASLLQETIFNSQLVENYSQKLRRSGYAVIDKVEKRLGKYFEINGIKPYVLFWSKVAKCKSCKSDLDLRRFEYLSKRKTKTLRVLETENGLAIDSSLGDEGELSKEFVCKNCNTLHSFKDIREFCKTDSFKYSPFAMCYHDKKKGYKVMSSEDKAVLGLYDEEIRLNIESISNLIPKEEVRSKSGVINPTIYDLKTPKDFFSNRQLLVLLTLMDELINEYHSLVKEYNKVDAKQILLGLTSLIEFLVDWNSVSTMWISQNEQTGRSLAGPGVGMKWDFIEINPFYGNGSNLRSKIDRVCDTFEAINFDNKVSIIKGSSTNLPLRDNSIDIVFTDPPYYDSIDYTGLSDFFRPWFEIVIRETYDKDINLKNQDEFEAIVELSKSSSRSKDHNHYKDIMLGVLSEANRVLKPDGSVLLMYSHKTIEGWEVIATAFQGSNLFISECIPLEMERSARPRAMAYEALNGVIVFKATKDQKNLTTIQQDILDIKKKIEKGDMYESQVIIYLAALACKEVTVTGKAYKECYENVTKLYQTTLIGRWMKNDMDNITIAYLEARLKNTLSELKNEHLDILNHHELIGKNKVKNLDEVDLKETLISTLFGAAHNIYTDFKYNSKTKVTVDVRKKESLAVFFSILAGTQLNTVAKRSSDVEIKTARLVLSKLD